MLACRTRVCRRILGFLVMTGLCCASLISIEQDASLSKGRSGKRALRSGFGGSRFGRKNTKKMCVEKIAHTPALESHCSPETVAMRRTNCVRNASARDQARVTNSRLKLGRVAGCRQPLSVRYQAEFCGSQEASQRLLQKTISVGTIETSGQSNMQVVEI